jgi:hypothetical protein
MAKGTAFPKIVLSECDKVLWRSQVEMILCESFVALLLLSALEIHPCLYCFVRFE